MFQKKQKYIFVFIALVSLTILTRAALAGPFDNNPILNAIVNNTYQTSDQDPQFVFVETLASVIFMLISFLGIFFIGLIMYGGYIWMNARGNESDVQKAQHIIRDAVIGLVVLGASYGAWILIYSLLFGEWVAV